MNYGDFKTQLSQYIHRTDLTALLPTFIEYGRIRMCDTLRVPEMVQKGAVAITAGEGALSQDLLSVVAVLDDTCPLTRVSIDTVRQYTSGVYAVQGQTLVAPGYGTVQVIWFDRPLTLVGASDSATRDVLEYYPQVWLQAALVEGYIYLDDTDSESKARERLAAEIGRANARSSDARFGVAPAVTGGYENSWSQWIN